METIINKIGYARVGLLGNPSDHFGGKCLSFTFDKKAQVFVTKNNRLEINGTQGQSFDLNYNGSNDLVKAVIKILRIENRDFKITYDSEIPPGVGLAGSSAISTATIKALNEYFNLNLDSFKIAKISRSVENEELNIFQGFQDGYSVTFGGIIYMDFAANNFVIKKIPKKIIPCFLCLSGAVKKNSGVVHNFIDKERQDVVNYMKQIASLVEQGVKTILDEDWEKLGILMNKNRELRNYVYPILKKDKEVADFAISSGAFGVKLTGSGGAVAVLTDQEDENKVFEAMKEKYICFKPKITDYE